MRKVVVPLIGVAVFLLVGGSAALRAEAQGPPCDFPTDFLTSGGFIVRDSGSKANLGLDGGCKNGSLTGQLNYIDRSIGLQVSGTSITGYLFLGSGSTPRIICGTATTNQFGNVDWVVFGSDMNEPGRDDEFIIRLVQFPEGMFTIVYTTEGDGDFTLGGPTSPGGGNIKVHKPQADPFLVGSCLAL